MPIPQPLLPPDLDDAVRRELATSERRLWAGTPDPGAFARAYIALTIFGRVFAGLAAVLMITPFLITFPHSMSAFIFVLSGIPLLLIGASLASTPLWMRRKAARTVYALTDRRAIVIEGSVFRGTQTVASYTPERLTNLSRTEHQNGTGDLVFEQVRAGYRKNGSEVYRPRGFLGIHNVREVEQLLQSTLLNPKAR
jgi:hypothetical protein